MIYKLPVAHLVAQTVETEQTIREENTKLYSEAEKAFRSGETFKSIIQHIALNLERIDEMTNQKEHIPDICSKIIREFKSRGLERLESSVYKALSEKQFARFKNEHYIHKSLEDSSDQAHDLPEDISVEMKQIAQWTTSMKKIRWNRYPNDFAQTQQVIISEAKEKVDDYEDANNILRPDKDYDPLEENARNSQYYSSRPVIEPPRDESLNPIRCQYEFLLLDIRSFIDNFVKRYYPPEEHQIFYARAIFLFRKFFTQYESNKIHRDYLSWSEINEADEGRHKSGKSAKEISARYGSKIRRYDKTTGEAIYGRKGICKEQIDKKKPSLHNFMVQVYQYIPLFMHIHNQYEMGKEKIFVDHAIDIKDKRQHHA